MNTAFISKTINKLQVNKYEDGYIMFFSGVKENPRASEEIVILVYISKRFESKIKSYKYILDRIMRVKLHYVRGIITLTSVYSRRR